MQLHKVLLSNVRHFRTIFAHAIFRRTLLIEAGYPPFLMTTSLVLRWMLWSCFFALTSMCLYSVLYLREVMFIVIFSYSRSSSLSLINMTNSQTPIFLIAGDFQVQLVTASVLSSRTSGSSTVPALNPAAPNFNVSRFSVTLGDSQIQQQVLPPSSRAHLWHEMSGKVVQQQQERWN